jgi:genetic interactor of prohibitins 3, mitochondrial
MRVTPQAILRFQLETRHQLLSLDFRPRRKIAELLGGQNSSARTQTRSLNSHRSPLLQQTAPTPVPPDDSISVSSPLKTLLSPREPQYSSPQVSTGVEQASLRHLPVSCPGCGAVTQDLDGEQAGFYTRSRRSVRDYVRRVKRAKSSIGNNATHFGPDEGSLSEDESQVQEIGPTSTSLDAHRRTLDVVGQELPFCDRCHNLLHQSKGAPIAHPTIDAIADSIAESSYRRNHVYHVLDAADFPLSLIPSIFHHLTLARPRSQNRRSQHDFSARTTISFIITRSDLLAPQKEMVDSLMPYFTSVLREALGRKGQDMRLGNVHLVSAKRGWWTKEIKETIYRRGGGNWMVGKFNVGKSNLFEVLFPKGHDEQAPAYSELQKNADQNTSHFLSELRPPPSEQALFSESSLLPPPQPSTPYPILPLVSSLPGTTASPIRLPFGSRTNPRGELVDLPGLPRSNLSHFVSPEHQRTLLMEHRPTVTQHVLRSGQSLLLGGGLVRITPIVPNDNPNPDRNPNDELIILAYPFTPLPAHVTSTPKATATQQQERESGIKCVLAPDAGESIRSAGVYRLDTDMTKSRSGPLLRAGVPLRNLPFRVRGTDVLVEGVGWVELCCQVRRRRKNPRGEQMQTQAQTQTGNRKGGDGDAVSALEEEEGVRPAAPSSRHMARHRDRTSKDDDEDEWPTPLVEVFTPHGQSVGQRRTMGAWMLIHGARKPGQIKTKKAAGPRKARPRKSMKGAKKREKRVRRERDGGGAGGGGSVSPVV